MFVGGRRYVSGSMTPPGVRIVVLSRQSRTGSSAWRVNRIAQALDVKFHGLGDAPLVSDENVRRPNCRTARMQR